MFQTESALLPAVETPRLALDVAATGKRSVLPPPARKTQGKVFDVLKGDFLVEGKTKISEAVKKVGVDVLKIPTSAKALNVGKGMAEVSAAAGEVMVEGLKRTTLVGKYTKKVPKVKLALAFKPLDMSGLRPTGHASTERRVEFKQSSSEESVAPSSLEGTRAARLESLSPNPTMTEVDRRMARSEEAVGTFFDAELLQLRAMQAMVCLAVDDSVAIRHLLHSSLCWHPLACYFAENPFCRLSRQWRSSD